MRHPALRSHGRVQPFPDLSSSILRSEKKRKRREEAEMSAAPLPGIRYPLLEVMLLNPLCRSSQRTKGRGGKKKRREKERGMKLIPNVPSSPILALPPRGGGKERGGETGERRNPSKNSSGPSGPGAHHFPVTCTRKREGKEKKKKNIPTSGYAKLPAAGRRRLLGACATILLVEKSEGKKKGEKTPPPSFSF